jgi:hypothetical protein
VVVFSIDLNVFKNRMNQKRWSVKNYLNMFIFLQARILGMNQSSRAAANFNWTHSSALSTSLERRLGGKLFRPHEPEPEPEPEPERTPVADHDVVGSDERGHLGRIKIASIVVTRWFSGAGICPRASRSELQAVCVLECFCLLSAVGLSFELHEDGSPEESIAECHGERTVGKGRPGSIAPGEGQFPA